ncbi:MAG: SDR family oxidoreductase, partial [Pseudomonadota bacterium]
LVTGGSRGLGREMALALKEGGADVMISGRSDGDAFRGTAAELASAGPGRSAHHAADVGDPAACEKLVAATIAAFGRIDVLVNNAGLGMRRISETFTTRPTRFWETEPEDWRAIIETNLNGAFYMARAATRHMVGQGRGKILNISTSAPTMVRPGYSPYGPGKAALEAASRVWAQDLAGTGVTVNVYLPGGASDTDLIPGGAGRRGADGQLLPADIMRRGIVWLASTRSDHVTGGRYTARLWDPSLPPDEAAAGARSAPCDVPAIL